MSELKHERREMDQVLRQPGAHPDPSFRISRRTFLHKSLLTGVAATAATTGWLPIINTIDVAYGAEAPFKFAWISDTHLYPKEVNTRFMYSLSWPTAEASTPAPTYGTPESSRRPWRVPSSP